MTDEPILRLLARRRAAEGRSVAVRTPDTTRPRTPLYVPPDVSLFDDLVRLPDWWRVRYLGKDDLPSDRH